MISVTNCSYTDGEGSNTVLECGGAAPYCCTTSGTARYCSASQCPTEDDESLDISTIIFLGVLGGLAVLCIAVIIFWGVLGGLIVFSIAVIMLVYFMCFHKDQRGCLHQSPADELLGSITPLERPTSSSSSGSQTIRIDMTHQKRDVTDDRSGASQNTPRLWNSALHAQTDHVIIRVSPQNSVKNETIRDRDKLRELKLKERNLGYGKTIADTSASCSTSSRQSQITSIASLHT